MAWLASALLLALAAGPSAPGSQAPGPSAGPDTVYLLPGLTVEARRLALARDLSLRPGFAALYLVDELPSPTATTGEALSQAVGVHVRQFGGLGSYSAVSVRGSNANQVAFYLDGVPLNQAQYGVTNPADLPLAAFDRIEVYRGTAPLVFANPGGGVVNLVTRPARGARGDARAGYGSFDARHAEAWGSWSGPRARLFGAYRYLAGRGDFVFLDDNGTPFNAADDEHVPRRNNAFVTHGFTAKLDLPLGRPGPGDPVLLAPPGGALGRLMAAADLLDKDSGLPGISSYQSRYARFATRRGLGSVSWASPAWLGRALELETQAYAVGARDRFTDLHGELGSGRQDTDDRTVSWGARQRAGITAGPLGQSLEFLIEARREEFQPRVRTPQPWTGPKSRRDALSLGVEERLEPWGDRVALTAGIRRESAFDRFPAGPAYAGALPQSGVERTTRFATGGAGIRARLAEDIVLRANAGVTRRLPSLFELFGNRGTVVGNRRLAPERLTNRDVGLAWSRRWGADGLAAATRPGAPAGGTAELSAEIALYRTDARDLILFLQNSQRASVAENVSAARLQGIETSVSARLDRLRFAANWTYQDTRDQSGAPDWDGNRLPGRPAHELFSREEYEARRWHLFHEFHYVAGNFLDRSERDPVPARRLHNLGVGATMARGAVRLTAEMRNATDDRVLDVAAYPLPGRSYALSVEVRIQ